MSSYDIEANEINISDQLSLVKTEDLKQEWQESDGQAYFKVILPASEEEEKEGIGELVWCTAKEDTLAELEDNAIGKALVELCNDSLYYPTLKCHTLIVIYMRGELMPVAEFKIIDKHFGPSQKEFIMAQLNHGIVFRDFNTKN